MRRVEASLKDQVASPRGGGAAQSGLSKKADFGQTAAAAGDGAPTPSRGGAGGSQAIGSWG